MIIEQTGVSKDKMCIFGDRLYTDIALGRRFGVTSVSSIPAKRRRRTSKKPPRRSAGLCLSLSFEADEVIFG